MKKSYVENILKLIMASFSYVMLCSNNILSSYDINSWLIYVLLLVLFYKTNICRKENKKESIIISCILSIIIVYGKLVYTNMDSKTISILRSVLSINFLCSLICYFNILFIIFMNIMPKIYNINITYTDSKKSNKKWFISCFIIILLAWLLYFLSFYPGTMSPDSIKEYKSICNGIKIVSDHHPVLHSLFIGVFYHIGMLLFNSKTSAIALVTVIQMIILSAIFSYVIVFLKERKVKKSILVVMTVFFGFLPMNGYYSITMWKDVLFAGFMLLLTIELIKLVDKNDKEKLNLTNFINYIIVSLLVIFFRNNAIYMWLFLSVIFYIFINHESRKSLIIASLVIIFVYLIIKIPIFKTFNIQKSETVEYVGIPLQQIGRMAYKEVDFTKEELDLINNLIPVSTMKEVYNPTAVDYIKFNKAYNKNAIESDKFNYFKLYLKLVYKHPAIAIEQYSISTLGYWYPGVKHWSTINNITENTYGLKTKSIIKNNEKSIIQKVEKRTVPILSIEWSIGLYFWLLFIFVYISIKKRGIQSLIIYSPSIGIWITMMLATPIYAEFRYIYCVAVAIPLLMIYPYLEIEKSKNNRRKKYGKK